MAVGSLNLLRKIYCPTSTKLENGSYAFSSECHGSIFSLKVGHKTIGVANKLSRRSHLTAGQAMWLSKRLVNAGLSRVASGKFLEFPINVIKNVEECIHAIMDALVLSFPEVFCLEEYTKLPIRLITRIIKLAVDSKGYEDIIAHYKVFREYIWLRASRAEGASPPMPRHCYFASLTSSIAGLRDILRDGIRTKAEATKIAHLVSTRQFPCGGVKAIKKSLDTFLESVTEPFNPPQGSMERLYQTATHLGKKAYDACGGQLPSGKVHISLSGAGDFDRPCSQGGRGSLIMEEITRILTVVPEVSSRIELALGITVQEEAGVARWRTWGRTETYRVPNPTPEKPNPAIFGQLIDNIRFNTGTAEYARWGFDEALGLQIYYCALTEARKSQLFNTNGELRQFRLGSQEDVTDVILDARTAVSCEPGGKARIVTTTKWWVVVLQQAVGHFFREVLAFLPSAKDGLCRADQAWLFLHAMENVTFADEDYRLLSSDLKEATDHIPHISGRTALYGFACGLGLQDDPFVQLGLALVSSGRRFLMTYPDGKKKVAIKTRGFMMGEPMTKSILTLMGLCAEEESFLHYKNAWRISANKRNPEGACELNRYLCDPILLVERLGGFKSDPDDSRAFRVGGDDHIAYGPIPYLQRITRNHLDWGNKISLTSHAIGKIVKYTEKVLMITSSTNFKIGPSLINRSTDYYEKSLFVDSVKVRLLSPVSRSIDTLDEKNVAIGKARSLGSTLRWLNRDYFPREWIRSVRDRFLFRMRIYLPTKHNKHIAKHLLLPSKLGGLDLYVDSNELEEDWSSYHIASRKLINIAVSGLMPRTVLKAATGMVTSGTKRGYAFESLVSKMLREYSLPEMALYLGLPIPREYDVEQLRAMLNAPYGSMAEQLRFFAEKGYVTEDAAIETTMRGTLFSAILSNSEKEKRYNTTRWPKRFATFTKVLEETFGSFLNDKAKHELLYQKGFDIEPFSWFSSPPQGWAKVLENNFCSFKRLTLYYVNAVDEEDTVCRYDNTGCLLYEKLSFKTQLVSGLPLLQLPSLIGGCSDVDMDKYWCWGRPALGLELDILNMMKAPTEETQPPTD